MRDLLFALACLMAVHATLSVFGYLWAEYARSPAAGVLLGLALLEVGVEGVAAMALLGSSGWVA